MIKVAHGSVWFKPEVEVRILELMKFQSSALRSACQAITKHKLKLNLEGRGLSIASTMKAYSWLKESFLRPKPSALTGLSLELGLKPSIEDDMGEIPMGEPSLTTGQARLINNQQDSERSPSVLGKFVQVQ